MGSSGFEDCGQWVKTEELEESDPFEPEWEELVGPKQLLVSSDDENSEQKERDPAHYYHDFNM